MATKAHYEPAGTNAYRLKSFCGRSYGGRQGGFVTHDKNQVECVRCLAKLERLEAKRAAKTATTQEPSTLLSMKIAGY